MSLWIVVMIAISLSMDAFSLSLAYGTLNINKKDRIKLSTIVGIYHFFMPLIGLKIGTILLKLIPISPEFVVFAVLTCIGIQMILESQKKEEIGKMKNYELLLFGLAVSIDSFSVGIGLNTITTYSILAAIIFSLSSFLFTFLGLFLGKKIQEGIGKIATIIGGTVLIILGVLFLK